MSSSSSTVAELLGMMWTEAEGIVGGRSRTGWPADILVIVVGSAGQGDGGSLIAVDGWRCNNNPIHFTTLRSGQPSRRLNKYEYYYINTMSTSNVCLRGHRCHIPEIIGITQIYSNYVHPALPLPPNANFIFIRFLTSCQLLSSAYTQPHRSSAHAPRQK